MTRRRYAVAAVVLVGLAGLVLLLQLAGGAPQPVPAGLPDPGALTGWGLPVLGYAGRVLGVLVVAGLLVPLLTSERMGEEIGGRGVAAVRTVRPLALAWLLTVLGELVLTFSDQFAQPLTQIRWSELTGFARQTDQGRSLLVQALLVLAVALLSRWLLTARETAALLALGITAQLPPVLTGHSAAAGSHDTAIISLLLHVAAASVWVGGVVALVWHLVRRSGPTPGHARATRRFSGVAAWCLGVVVVSGALNALVRLGSPSPLLTTGYGRGVLAKLVVVVALGLVAVRLRRALAERPPTGRVLTALVTTELTLMSLAIALGVGLGRTPPPAGEPYTSVAENLLGGPVPPAPTLGRLLTSFQLSGVALLVVGLGSAAYLVGILALRRRGQSWPVLRSVSWSVGLLLVGYATAGGLGTYSHVMFSAHMAAHMVLSMIAPIFLVLGAPITLALRALPGADVPGGHGPRQWLAAALRSRPARLVAHPVSAAVVSVASLYVVYFSGLFDALMGSHLGHAVMELHFLVAGCLFFEVLVGDAPVPRRLSHLARLGLLLVVMPFHAFFAISVMSSSTVLGGEYYALLDRGFATDLLGDQYLGGSMTWALGELPMVLVLVVLLAQWVRSDRRAAARLDRDAARGDDDQLDAYNAMLAGLAHTDRTPRSPATGEGVPRRRH
jgi:cytochrome c oxidase assembly factor CtaG